MRGEYRFCVIEHKRQKTGLNLVSHLGEQLSASVTEPCWNLVFDVPFDNTDEVEANIAFDACHAWLENNANATSEYVITEMFFYSKRASH